MKFTAAGDVIIQQRMNFEPKDFGQIKAFIEKGDARFFNLETTLNYEGECYASQYSGGTYIRTNPESLGDFLSYGFNITTFNNNHAMDFSYEGLLKTKEYIDSFGIPHSGVGENLAAASAPAYLDTANGRVALVSISTSFNPAAMAGEASRRMAGRPGVNGLRISERIGVSKEDIATLKRIAEKTGVNAYSDIVRREGYLPPEEDGVCTLGDLKFLESDEYQCIAELNAADLLRVEKAIFEAKLQADYIIVSLHSHQVAGGSKEAVPQFLEQFSKFCVDKGANAVIGHGPHLLRPIEIYKNSPIFYSLGDFVLQLYSIAFAPEDFYEKYGLTSDATVHELLAKRSKNFTRGLMEDKKMFETVVPYWEADKEGRITRLELLPLTLSMGEDNLSMRGLPKLSDDLSFIDRLAKMSAPYGTKIYMKDGIAVCEW